MNQIPTLRRSGPAPGCLAWAAGLATALAALCVFPAAAETVVDLYRPVTAVPGGLDPHPYISTSTQTQGVATVTWSGLQAPYQLQGTPTLSPTAWQNLGAPIFGKRATLPLPGESMGFLRVLGDEPSYVGASQCQLCHRGTHTSWTDTAHAKALKTLQDAGQSTNRTCLPCHTVGFGYAGGYHDDATTPKLANVQCENCHGPAVRHVENVDDLAARPAVTPAAEVCGGCHNGFHQPTYDNWQQSKHAVMEPDVGSEILAEGEPRMRACGPCHSGATRLALLDSVRDPATPLPSRSDAAHYPVTCVVCHNPHRATANGAQLRNPLYSTNNFSYSTATSTTFAAQYDPNVQICGQCHNQRGAKWQDTSRPPHHSPQYNILIGQGAYDPGAPGLVGHGLEIERQCVQCHTHPQESDPLTPPNPNYAGHTFEVRFEGCTGSAPTVECHESPASAKRVAESVQKTTKSQIAAVKGRLDQWATTKAPAPLRTQYGALAWEYTNPGQLSNPTGDPALKGPNAEEQKTIPDAIKQARMNLYLTQHDASFGVHNFKYASYILDVAQANVEAELAKP